VIAVQTGIRDRATLCPSTELKIRTMCLTQDFTGAESEYA
jgi:hypothetical protein